MQELAAKLREYAATEHGKRARLHFDIMRLVFTDPNALADAIEGHRQPMADDAFARLAAALGATRTEQ